MQVMDDGLFACAPQSTEARMLAAISFVCSAPGLDVLVDGIMPSWLTS